jgi:ketosteroid isomerase-like protein
MSQEGVELVRRAFEALERGDLALLDNWTTPDVVIVQPPEVPDTKS